MYLYGGYLPAKEINCIAVGTDYDGVPPDAFMAIDHPGRMSELWEALTDAGIPKATLKKIAHENFLGLL